MDQDWTAARGTGPSSTQMQNFAYILFGYPYIQTKALLINRSGRSKLDAKCCGNFVSQKVIRDNERLAIDKLAESWCKINMVDDAVLMFAGFIHSVVLQSLMGLWSHGAYAVKQRQCSICGLANIFMYDIC